MFDAEAGAQHCAEQLVVAMRGFDLGLDVLALVAVGGGGVEDDEWSTQHSESKTLCDRKSPKVA